MSRNIAEEMKVKLSEKYGCITRCDTCVLTKEGRRNECAYYEKWERDNKVHDFETLNAMSGAWVISAGGFHN